MKKIKFNILIGTLSEAGKYEPVGFKEVQGIEAFNMHGFKFILISEDQDAPLTLNSAGWTMSEYSSGMNIPLPAATYLNAEECVTAAAEYLFLKGEEATRAAIQKAYDLYRGKPLNPLV